MMSGKNYKNFQKIYNDQKLSHHPFKRMFKYLNWCFKNIDFNDQNVLDIGGGNGIFSYYSKFKGAKEVVNLEPFSDGSTFFDFSNQKINSQLEIHVKKITLQEFKTNEKFGIIILHDSINHLDESLFENIHKSEKDYKDYQKIIDKIISLLSPNGQILVTDCSRRNFWGDLGLKSPFAPSIEWNLHQSPKLIQSFFKNDKFSFILRWSPFKRLGSLGKIISFLGVIPSYFMQSHFNLLINKK
tara:strand:+ start:4929 stop:5654 length:726 start_codon:yes stop_codon:yes gene_type:complete